MGLEVVALIVAAATAVPVAFAYGFGLAAPNSGVASSITDTSPCVSHSSDFIVCGGSRWQASIGRGTVCRSTFLSMAKGSEHDAPRRFGLTMEDSTRVSRALNRALGRILSTGDMFGSVGGKSLSDDSRFGKDVASALDRAGQRGGGAGKEAEFVEGDEEDEEGSGEGDDTSFALSDLEDVIEERHRPSWQKIGLKRRKVNTNVLLQAKTTASAAIVVDGPFSPLEAYMTLPVSEYSLLDSSIIRRISETTFRFQIPLEDLVGLDFTPTMEVEVELVPDSKAVVFRSTRSSLYGKIDKPGDEAITDPWPEAASNKLEYFRVDFNARLSWADGDASKARRQRGKGGFSGDFARRSRPVPRSPFPSSLDAATNVAGETVGIGGNSGAAAATVAGTTRFPGAAMAVLTGATAADDGSAALQITAEPATVFCETEVTVQVVLPPPYNALLPRRLVRALLSKVLSTIMGYVLPRFLEATQSTILMSLVPRVGVLADCIYNTVDPGGSKMTWAYEGWRDCGASAAVAQGCIYNDTFCELLANDFYGWQSGNRRAPATASETARTLLGAEGTAYTSGTERGGIEMDVGDEDDHGEEESGLEQEREGEDSSADRRRRRRRRGWGGGRGASGGPINWWG